MEKAEEMIKLWDTLSEAAPNEDIPVEGAVNLKAKPISNYKVRLAYGDLTLIIAMVHDYVKELDKRLADGTIGMNPIEYEAYYRKKLLGMADRIAEQIDYDYDAQVAKCIKKMSKQSNSDVGEEAIALTVKRGMQTHE